MKLLATFILTIVLLIGSAARAQNQVVFAEPDPKADSIWASERDAYVNKRIGTAFPLSSVVTAVDGRQLDFGKLAHTTVVCLGFYGCHPCMRELPGFVQASKDNPEIDFVYITYDAARERDREFSEAGLKNFKPGPNYFIIHMDRAEIDRLKLASGYPTKYVVSSNGGIRNMMFSFPGNGNLKEQVDQFIHKP